ncbi:hypothetical protein V5N11_003538 [Cardamine amara subsp. amara]|uniref:Uncharacterized protein n=1 Tax=Cardamine amara subsp. amara TaxID=228776 RepID=A0ABD1C265_CARAN
MAEEILADDPLEIALTQAEGEHGFLSEDTAGFAKMLDSSQRVEKMVACMNLEVEEEFISRASDEATALENLVNDPWSELKAPKLKLKTLPVGLRVLKCCEEKHFVLNWEKCHFMVRDGIVLGHQILEKGIEVNKAKIEVMMSLLLPKACY